MSGHRVRMPALHMRTHASVMSMAMATFSSGFKLPNRFPSSGIFANMYHSDKFSVSSHCSSGFNFLCVTAGNIACTELWAGAIFSLGNYMKAVNRGVNYRVVLESPGFDVAFQEGVQALLARPGFELRLSRGPLATNAAIFDDKEVTINFFQGKPIGESPIIWTNHPSFIQMCKDHFKQIWKSAQEHKLTEETKKTIYSQFDQSNFLQKKIITFWRAPIKKNHKIKKGWKKVAVYLRFLK
jgi:hypothetical protein